VALGVALIQIPKRVTRSTTHAVPLTPAVMEEILVAWRDGKILRESILPLLAALTAGVPFDRERLPALCTQPELDAAVHRAVSVLSEHPPNDPSKLHEVLMGQVMTELRGRVDGRTVREAVGRGAGRTGS
jgi:Glu-tRNA(Gln) amidotransferase subunit E-like FAD-binding protein